MAAAEGVGLKVEVALEGVDVGGARKATDGQEDGKEQRERTARSCASLHHHSIGKKLASMSAMLAPALPAGKAAAASWASCKARVTAGSSL